MATRGNVRYQSDGFHTPYTFLYPADWKVRELGERGYVDTAITGPRNRAGTYSVGLAVGIEPAAEQTPAEAAATVVSRYRSAFGCQERGPFSTTVAGTPAVEVEIAYWMPLPLNSIHPEWTVIWQRHVFFKRGSLLYDLRYTAPEEDYETWLPALRTLVESFAFAEKPAYRPIYRPAATAAVPQYVHDKSPEYQAEGSQSDEQPETNSHKEENHD